MTINYLLSLIIFFLCEGGEGGGAEGINVGIYDGTDPSKGYVLWVEPSWTKLKILGVLVRVFPIKVVKCLFIKIDAVINF